MLLGTITKVLRLVLGEAAVTELPYVIAFADTAEGTTFVPGSAEGLSSDTTPVTMVAAPAAGVQRHVKSINIYNADSITHTVFVQVFDGVTTSNLVKCTLPTLRTLHWSVETGWIIGTSANLVPSTTDDLPEGATNLYFTTERAQDAVGAAGTDTATIDFVYTDGSNIMEWNVINGSITFAKMQAITDGRLLGASGGTAVEEITVGTGLSLAANTLSSTITQYTDEMAQDAVGAMVNSTLTYTDGGPTLGLNLSNQNTWLAAIITAAGSAALPSLGVGDTDTGLYSPAANQIGFSVAGVGVGVIGASQASFSMVGATYSVAVSAEGIANNIVAAFGAGNDARYNLRFARGTIAAPTVVVTNDSLGTLNWAGYSGAIHTFCASIETIVVEVAPSASLMGSLMRGTLVPVGSNTRSEIWRFTHEAGFSMFGANPVVDQNRTVCLRSYTTASPPTLVTGGLTFDSTYNSPIYGGATTRRLVMNGHPLTTSATASKLINRLSVAPSENLERLIRDVYNRLSGAGLLTKLKGLWVLADPYSELAQADALLNWITPGTNDLAIVGSLTYTAGQGFTGDGATGYLSTVNTPAVYGLALDDIAWGVDIRTANSTARGMVGQVTGNSRQLMTIGASSTVATRVSASASDTFTPAAYTGLFQFWRVASTGYQWSLNGVAGATLTETSTALGNLITFLANPLGPAFSDGQIRLAFLATGGWTDANAAALYKIFSGLWFNGYDGTYTPALTNVANLTSTAAVCQWSRVGDTITVSGKANVDPTLTVTSTQLGISLPVPSLLTADTQCAGAAFCKAIASQGAAILGDTTNDRAQMEWIAGDVSAQDMFFSFTYRVL